RGPRRPITDTAQRIGSRATNTREIHPKADDRTVSPGIVLYGVAGNGGSRAPLVGPGSAGAVVGRKSSRVTTRNRIASGGHRRKPVASGGRARRSCPACRSPHEAC